MPTLTIPPTNRERAYRAFWLADAKAKRAMARAIRLDVQAQRLWIAAQGEPTADHSRSMIETTRGCIDNAVKLAASWERMAMGSEQNAERA